MNPTTSATATGQAQATSTTTSAKIKIKRRSNLAGGTTFEKEQEMTVPLNKHALRKRGWSFVGGGGIGSAGRDGGVVAVEDMWWWVGMGMVGIGGVAYLFF